MTSYHKKFNKEIIKTLKEHVWKGDIEGVKACLKHGANFRPDADVLSNATRCNNLSILKLLVNNLNQRTLFINERTRRDLIARIDTDFKDLEQKKDALFYLLWDKSLGRPFAFSTQDLIRFLQDDAKFFHYCLNHPTLLKKDDIFHHGRDMLSDFSWGYQTKGKHIVCLLEWFSDYPEHFDRLFETEPSTQNDRIAKGFEKIDSVFFDLSDKTKEKLLAHHMIFSDDKKPCILKHLNAEKDKKEMLDAVKQTHVSVTPKRKI